MRPIIACAFSVATCLAALSGALAQNVSGAWNCIAFCNCSPMLGRALITQDQQNPSQLILLNECNERTFAILANGDVIRPTKPISTDPEWNKGVGLVSADGQTIGWQNTAVWSR